MPEHPPAPSVAGPATPVVPAAAPPLTRAERALQRHVARSALAAAPPGKPTFKKTSPTAGAASAKKKVKKPRKSMPGVERLFRDASARKAKLERRRESYDAKNTFTPKITKRGHLSV